VKRASQPHSTTSSPCSSVNSSWRVGILFYKMSHREQQFFLSNS